jgi:hypothetical protein
MSSWIEGCSVTAVLTGKCFDDGGGGGGGVVK